MKMDGRELEVNMVKTELSNWLENGRKICRETVWNRMIMCRGLIVNNCGWQLG